MPTVQFAIAVSGDDAKAEGSFASYPPPAGTTTNDTDTDAGPGKILAGDYFVSVFVFRWDTSSIPDGATVTDAVFRAKGAAKNNVDSRSITLEWYAFDGSVANSDWTSTVGTDAHAGRTIASLSSTADEDFTLLNPAANINKSGYTGLRIHVDGTAPTSENYWSMYLFDHATQPAPRLIVSYTEVPTYRFDGVFPKAKLRTAVPVRW